MSDVAFPPQSLGDIEAYDLTECVAGYCDWQRDDMAPGPNHSPAYRWGWSNAARDHGTEDDGFDSLRHLYARHKSAPTPSLSGRAR